MKDTEMEAHFRFMILPVCVRKFMNSEISAQAARNSLQPMNCTIISYSSIYLITLPPVLVFNLIIQLNVIKFNQLNICLIATISLKIL